MRFLRTIFRWTILLGFVACAAFGIYYYMQPKPIGVDVANVKTGRLVVTVDEDGIARIKERYIVSAPLNGRLARVRWKPGDWVLEESTLLAAIAPRNPDLLDKREKLQAEMRVKASEAAMERAVPVAERAKSDYEYAKKSHKRIKSLVPSRAVTKGELDKAESALEGGEQDVRAAIYAQHIAKYELDLARAALVRTQSNEEPDYTDFEIYSPITGRVLRVLQESATVVSPGTSLIEVGDHHDLEVVVDVLSSDAVSIKPDADVLLDRWGGEQPLHGKVRLIEPAAFTKLSALGVEEQRVNIIIDIVEPAEERATLGDGYRVEARIVTWQRNKAVKVPSAALFRHKENWAVFSVDPAQRARLRLIKIGPQNDFEAEVIEGLETGESVILHPSDKMEDGVEIERR